MNARNLMVVAIALSALSACTEHKEEADAEQHVEVAASTTVVSAQPFVETLNAIGTVVPRAGSIVMLSAPATTRVARVYVVTGQRVEQGTPLVEFEQSPFVARATAAAAALDAAQRAHERTQRLVTAGILARKELEQSAAALAQAQLEASVARRDVQLSHLESPIGGVVTKMSAVLGSTVDPSQPLVEIADPNAVDILVTVSPDDAARIANGSRVVLSTGQGSTAQPLGTSTIVSVGAVVDPDTRGVEVRIRATNLGRRLRIGESIAAAITVAEFPSTITIPAEALVPSGEGYHVFVVDSADVAHERAVKVGGTVAQMVRVIDGLTAGEKVVTTGAFGVSDGATVHSK